MTTNPQTALTSAVYDALVTFNKSEHWPQLRLAQIRQHLAEHIAAQVELSLTGLPAAPAAGRVVSAAPTRTDDGPVCRSEQGCHRVVLCDPGCGAIDLLAEATRPRPEPADRAAVLLEVADWLKAWRPEFFERWAVAERDRYEGGVDDAAAELRRLADETPAAAEAQPAFFQPGRTYIRDHHGDTIRFLVRHVSEAPDGSYRVAFGWRLDGDGDWEPTDSDDITGWTDAAGARQDGAQS